MDQVRWVFGRTNAVRMSGVAVLGLVITLFSWLGRHGAFSRDGADVDVDAWQQGMELGVLVMCFALLFVAIGLLMGLPEEERPREETSPPVDHWS